MANGTQATPNSVIMACSKLLCQFRPHHAQLVIRATGSAVKQQSPRALNVLQNWDAFQECLVLSQHLEKMSRHEILMSQRSSEHLDPLFRRHQSRSFPHWLKAPCICGDGLKGVASPWANATGIPRLDLPEVHSDVGVPVQMLLESGETVRHPIRCGHRVHIVQECQQSLCGSEVVWDRLQRSMLPEGEKEGHHGVALFTALALHNVVDGAGIVLPERVFQRSTQVVDSPLAAKMSKLPPGVPWRIIQLSNCIFGKK